MEAFSAGVANVMADEAARSQLVGDVLTEIAPSTPAGSSAFAAYRLTLPKPPCRPTPTRRPRTPG